MLTCLQLCVALLAVQCRAMYICSDKCEPVAEKCQAMSTQDEREKCMKTTVKECFEVCGACMEGCIEEHEACDGTMDECIKGHVECNDDCARPRPPPRQP